MNNDLNGKTNKPKRKNKQTQTGKKRRDRSVLKKKKPKWKNKQTQTAKQKRDRYVLKNQHRDILAKKKKTQTEKQTNPNGKTKKRQIGAYRNDRSSWVSLGRSSWVWVLIGARSYGSVLLWIGAYDRSCGSVLWIGDRSCGSMLVIGAVDQSYGSELGRSV